jgi:putative membrane protein
MILSLSAFFELVEWVVADRFFPEHAVKYLGMQGDMWDAQKDIFFACLGAGIMMGFVYLHHRLRRSSRRP